MKEIMGWLIAGTVASVALLSLGASANPGFARTLSAAKPAAVTPAASQGALLANAYFRVAREAPGLDPQFDSWLIRHEITVKGIAAQRGENPPPETIEAQNIQPALIKASAAVKSWRAANQNVPKLAGLTASLQVRYDWWVMLTEAQAPQSSLDAAQHLYEDAQTALTTAARSRYAAL